MIMSHELVLRLTGSIICYITDSVAIGRYIGYTGYGGGDLHAYTYGSQ